MVKEEVMTSREKALVLTFLMWASTYVVALIGQNISASICFVGLCIIFGLDAMNIKIEKED